MGNPKLVSTGPCDLPFSEPEGVEGPSWK